MTRAEFSHRRKNGEQVRFHCDGDYVSIDVHMAPASSVAADVLLTGRGESMRRFGILTFGPASVYTPPDLAERIGEAIDQWKTDQAEKALAAAEPVKLAEPAE